MESVGSASCVPTHRCSSDMPVLWISAVLAVFGMATVQLVVVSRVWLVAPGTPTGVMKLAIYFAQVRQGHSCVCVCGGGGLWTRSPTIAVLSSLLHMRWLAGVVAPTPFLSTIGALSLHPCSEPRLPYGEFPLFPRFF